MRVLPSRGLLTVLSALLLADAGSARADALRLRYVPAYDYAAGTTTGADGVTTETEAHRFGQDFLLNFDKSVFPALAWTGSGLLEWNKSWARTDDLWLDGDVRRWAGNTRLELGTPALRGSVGYARSQTDAVNRLSGVTTRADGPISDTYSLDLLWNPADLPRATFSVSRRNVYDFHRREIDIQTNVASFSLDYAGLENWQFRYAYLLNNPNNVLRRTETLSQTHAARASWGDQFLDGRLGAFASYSAGLLTTRTTSGAAGGTRETQRLPSAGLSRIEAFPDVPARVTLQPTPALVDSDVSTGAGIDLGYGKSLAGDTALRDLGAQFPDDKPELNTIYVYVDRPLPDSLVGAFGWEAYVSDDNLTWTSVPVVGVPPFGILQNRFEITIPRMRSRYVKVVTRPLATGRTTDPLFAEILVTELQFSLIEELPPGTVRSSEVSGALSGGLRFLLLREPKLAYDMAFMLSHRDERYPDRGSLQHSLTLNRTIAQRTQLSASATRLDSFDDTSGHTGQTSWGAAALSEPLATLGWNANYSGSYTSSDVIDSLTNGVNAGLRADLYDGVTSNASASYRFGDSRGQLSQNVQAGAGLTLTPHRALTATGTFGWTYSDAWGGGMSARRSRSGRVEGSVSFNPLPALYLAATAARNLFGLPPAVQTSVTAGLSLFPSGGLSLRVSFSQTDDALTDTQNRSYGAGLTWNIFRGRSLSVSYNHLRTRSPLERSDVDAAHAVLQLPVF